MPNNQLESVGTHHGSLLEINDLIVLRLVYTGRLFLLLRLLLRLCDRLRLFKDPGATTLFFVKERRELLSPSNLMEW